MTVSADDLERHLAALSARVQNRRAGIYGPGTLSWEVNREGVIMLGGGAAALLQLAHPFVAHAVDQHSHTRNDPAGRFQRTFRHVFAMVFGDLDHALSAARRVHALHQTIRGRITEDVGRFRRGDRYQANDERALLWVHATLVDTALQVYERIVTPLHPHERNAYYEVWRAFLDSYDLLLTPTLPCTAFAAGDDHPGTIDGRETTYLGWTAFTYPVNLTGQPAASVPCGFVDGLPVGLQIIGGFRQDRTVLRAARAFEEMAPWAEIRPRASGE